MGITGKKWADKLGEEGTEILQLNNSEIPLSSIKRSIENSMEKN